MKRSGWSFGVGMSVCFALGVSLSASAMASVKTSNICASLERAVAKGAPEKRLAAFLDVQWKDQMREYPEWATYTGFPGQNDRWTDLSAAAIARRKEDQKCQLQALKKIPAAGLKGEDRITYDLAVHKLDVAIESQRFPSEELPLTHMNGLHIDSADLIGAMPRSKVSDYEMIFARLQKLPELSDQTIALMRAGLAHKVTPVKMFLKKVPAQIDAISPADPEKSPFFRPFQEFDSSIAEADRARLKSRALVLIKDVVNPTMRRLKVFIETEYIPGATEEISWSKMPDGPAWYALMAREHTTTKMTPQELHDLGLREVERIKGEMEKVRTAAGFKGDLTAFNKFLLTDSKFFYKTPEDLMLGYRDIAKRIDGELPRLFRLLPRLPYAVHEMPAYKAAEAPTAYYMGGSLAGGRAGSFEANTYDLKARPRWGMEALTLHEAVPGHHLQISLAQELEGLPEFRKNEGPTAFIEGWGLYAESLGGDLGMYRDPYSRYGQLSYEMWRAVRLVVDTGMHELGWSRDRALEYYMSLMPKSRLESEVEIDRYITWPGQALAYKVGQLKFTELREKARAQLGDRFDIRDFHEEILRHGALPMDVLEQTFDRWLASRLKAPAKK